MADNAWNSGPNPAYTNGSGKCPMGAAHDVSLYELGRRVGLVESGQRELDNKLSEIIAGVRALTEHKEERKAQLTAGTAILVALIAALATVGAQFLSAIFTH
jgi:hypothetical protein